MREKLINVCADSYGEAKDLAYSSAHSFETGQGTETKKRKKAKPGFKQCKCCGRELPVDDFNYWNKQKGTRMTICKECEHEKSRQKREHKKNLLIELKEVGCCVCGETDPICLDFHHYDQSEKEFNISQALTKSVKDMLLEASKCVVVCSNCHRKIHAGTLMLDDFVSPHEYEYRRKLITMFAEELTNIKK